MQDAKLAAGDKSYGWFVRAATEAFEFLPREFGFSPPEAHVHFQGTFVAYRHDGCSIAIELEPETRDVRAVLTQNRGDVERQTHLWDLLAERDRAVDWHPWPRQRGLREAQIVSLLQDWADGLRMLAPDVLEDCASHTHT